MTVLKGKVGMGNLHLLKRAISCRSILREEYILEVIKTATTMFPLKSYITQESFLYFQNHFSKGPKHSTP